MKHTHRYLLYFADVDSFPAGHDPATFDLEGRYSIQLNYGNMWWALLALPQRPFSYEETVLTS